MTSLACDVITEQFDSPAYQLLEKIGEGGFGRVYRAKQINTGQIVAIKFLSVSPEFDYAKRVRYIERFERETLLGSRLQHPHIVRLLDKGSCEDLLYAVFEYVDGKTLKQTLAESGTLSAVETAEVMTQVLDALAHAHQQGVIHRDIKPANIMLSKSGAKTHAKVLDFGIGTLVNEARLQDYKSITLTQETLGTPSYSAPEQLRGEPPTLKTDLYVWGLVFIECLTGQPAMSGSSLASVFHKQLSQSNVPLPATIVGHPIAALLRRVLQKKAHERSVNAQELYKELAQINFSNLVGDIAAAQEHKNHHDITVLNSDFDETIINDKAAYHTGLTERKQITALSINLSAHAVSDEIIDYEVVDTLLRDQKNQCLDTAIRYGAYHVGTLADSLLFYFGYPAVSDNDSRLCARTALDIISSLNKRNALLKTTQGVELDVRIGIHTGFVTCHADATPEGNTANIAMQLARLACKDKILCSDVSQKMLQTYIEFEPAQSRVLGVNRTESALYNLTAERYVEAFGFLRGTQSNHAFIGREQELKQLIQQLNNSSSESETADKLAHVYGEAGIGKSRLIFELRNSARQMIHYVAQCLPEHQNNALYPILNVIKYKYSLDALAPESALQKLRHEIVKLEQVKEQDAVPVLCAWLGLPLPDEIPPTALSPELQKQVLFETLITLLVCNDTLGTQQANLFIFEDMHWADPTSIEFIASLSCDKRFIAANNLFISSSRQPLPESLSDSGFQLLKLVKLTQENTREFVRILFDKENVSANLLDVIVTRTDGIPLFIEELVNMLKQKGLVHKLNGLFDFISPDKLYEVPSSLRDSLQQKLDTLVYAKETAQLAATIGREFDYDLLVAASNHSEAQVQNDLNELIDAELIYQQRKVSGDSYIFKHALVRDAAYQSASHSNLKKIHLEVAKVLSEKDDSQKNITASHYADAEKYIEAIEYITIAIRESISLSSFIEAKAFFNMAEVWAEKEVSEVLELRLELYKSIFPAAISQDGMGAEIVAYIGNQIVELEKKLNIKGEIISDALFLSQWAELQNFHYRSETNNAIVSGEASLKLAEKDSHRQRQLLLLAQMVQVYTCAGDLDKSISTGEKALSLYREEEDSKMYHEFGWDPKCVALSQMSHTHALLGDISKSFKCIEEAKKHAEFLNSEIDLDIIQAFETLLYYLIRDKKTIQIKTLDLHDDRDWTKDNWFRLFVQLAKDWSVTKTDISKSFCSMLLSDNRGGPLFYWLPMWLESEIKIGNYEEMKKLILPLIELSEHNGLIGPIPILLRTLALIEIEMGSKDKAENLFKEALKLAGNQSAPMMTQDVATHFSRFLINEKRTDESQQLVQKAYKNIKQSERIYINEH